MDRPLALVVDKDPAVRAFVRDVFEEHNITVLGAAGGDQAREFLKSRPVGVVVAEIEAPDLERLELFAHAPGTGRGPIVIGLAPNDDQAAATEFVKSGAFDVLFKPLSDAALQRAVCRGLRQHESLENLRRLREDRQSREGYHGLLGRSAMMERLRERMRQVAPAAGAVWFTGEPGTGRELAARTLHSLSGNGDAAFVVVPCVSLSPREWDTRWNGPDGFWQQARGGTLYLEEITELPLELQERLLGALGSDGSSSVRVMVSASSAPADAVEQGRVLDELRRSIAKDALYIPPLRERAEDIPLLARHFISLVCEINHLSPFQLAPEAVTLMERYHWPENVQELRNAMEQAVILAGDGNIRPRELPHAIREVGVVLPSVVEFEGASLRGFREAKREIVEMFERGYLRELMERHGGNVTAASQQAGMLRSALQRLLRKYGLKSAEFRARQRASASAGDESARSTVD